jgi:hypothetical protein
VEEKQCRPNVESNQFFVALARAVLVASDLKPVLDDLTDGHARPWVPALVDLMEQPGERGLGGVPGRRGLLQVPGLARQGVDAGVDDRAERAVRTLLDVAPTSVGSACHATTIRTRSFPRPFPRPASAMEDAVTAQVRRGGPGRIRTCDTRFRRAVLYPLSYEA